MKFSMTLINCSDQLFGPHTKYASNGIDQKERGRFELGTLSLMGSMSSVFQTLSGCIFAWVTSEDQVYIRSKCEIIDLEPL